MGRSRCKTNRNESNYKLTLEVLFFLIRSIENQTRGDPSEDFYDTIWHQYMVSITKALPRIFSDRVYWWLFESVYWWELPWIQSVFPWYGQILHLAVLWQCSDVCSIIGKTGRRKILPVSHVYLLSMSYLGSYFLLYIYCRSLTERVFLIFRTDTDDFRGSGFHMRIRAESSIGEQYMLTILLDFNQMRIQSEQHKF